MIFSRLNSPSRLGMITTLLLLYLVGGIAQAQPDQTKPILLVVMDPLSSELACACVEGKGQRNYRKLSAKLEEDLGQEVVIEFSDDLKDTLSLIDHGPEIIVIGERSTVAWGALQAGLKCHPFSELTDTEGSTTYTGSFIAQARDPANDLKDLTGRPLYFGLANINENHTLVSTTLRKAGVKPPAQVKDRGDFSNMALDVLDNRSTPRAIGVIPNYALPLLYGCGSIAEGELKVVGNTVSIPFITAFMTDSISDHKQKKILKTLLSIKDDPKLLKAMESRHGFIELKAKTDAGRTENPKWNWPDWRGQNRDGHVPKLPERLPTKKKVIWKQAAMTNALAGLSVSDGRLIMAERDFGDEYDVYRCLDIENGEELWCIEFPAPGELDYGQSPRATPVIHDGRVFLLGAFGDLRCVDVSNGKLIWSRQIPKEFKTELPIWGMSSTPLVVDDLLIINPGAKNASLAALECATGHTRWTSPGDPAAYSAFILNTFGGKQQLVGYDEHSLGGWDVKTGNRLWRLEPNVGGDFNVPTPIAVNGNLLVATENNGTRLYQFDKTGRIIPKPLAKFEDLEPDTSTPVVTCGRVFGSDTEIHCLDLKKGLEPVWEYEDDALGVHSTLIADSERVLIITMTGELILMDAKADSPVIISRLQVFDSEVDVYSHSVLVGTRLYIRGGYRIMCLDLKV